MSYNLVDPITGDLTRVAGNSNIVDTAIEIDSTWSSKKINDSLVNIESALDELENITRLTDFDEAIPEKGKNKIYYVNKIIGTYKCAQWRVESMYYDVSELGQYRGVQRATSINGIDNIMLMREYYLGDNNVIRWSDWEQLATKSNLMYIPIETDRTITFSSDYTEVYMYRCGYSNIRAHIEIDTLCNITPNAGWIPDMGIVLPEGYRPHENISIPAWCSSDTESHIPITLMIGADGRISGYVGQSHTSINRLNITVTYFK